MTWPYLETTAVVLAGLRRGVGWITYGLCDVVDDDCAVGVSVVHRCEGLVSLLAGRVPYFELDGRRVVEGDGLCEEGGSDGGFSVVVELILEDVSVHSAPRSCWAGGGTSGWSTDLDKSQDKRTLE